MFVLQRLKLPTSLSLIAMIKPWLWRGDLVSLLYYKEQQIILTQHYVMYEITSSEEVEV